MACAVEGCNFLLNAGVPSKNMVLCFAMMLAMLQGKHALVMPKESVICISLARNDVCSAS